jgi:type I restriction enzyme S subunit
MRTRPCHGLTPIPAFEVKTGDFLMNRANNLELVGSCTIVDETPPHLMLCDKLFRFIFRDDSPIEIRFLDQVLKSPQLREQIERSASGTSPTMKNISKSKVLALRIPCLPVDEQRRAAVELNIVKARLIPSSASTRKQLRHLKLLSPPSSIGSSEAN